MNNMLSNSRLCVSDEKYTNNSFLLKCYLHILSSDTYFLHPIGFSYKINNDVVAGNECRYVLFPQLYVPIEEKNDRSMIKLIDAILRLKKKEDFDRFYDEFKYEDEANNIMQIIDWKKVYSYYGGIEIHKYDTSKEKSDKKEWWIDWEYSGCLWNSEFFILAKLD